MKEQSPGNWFGARVNRPKLLVVDDQAVNIHVIHELFRNEYEVFMATNGEQAVSLCQDVLPDLILLDVVMKDMNGHEVCRLLKADALTRGIPVIFVTAQHLESDEALGFELGAVDFISKPINPVIVRARVRTHIALKIQSDALRSIAMVDGLTGVANRRKFDESMEINLRQCMREQAPLSLIMVDVDYFKLYNDRYGHQAGDDCLRQVAKALQQLVQRPYDLLARYGGEEFVCILPKTEAQGVLHLANKMLSTVRALEIEHLDSEISPNVTISLGVATMVVRQEARVQDLIGAADQQLYEQKNNGRDGISSIVLS